MVIPCVLEGRGKGLGKVSVTRKEGKRREEMREGRERKGVCFCSGLRDTGALDHREVCSPFLPERLRQEGPGWRQSQGQPPAKQGTEMSAPAAEYSAPGNQNHEGKQWTKLELFFFLHLLAPY